MARQEQLRSVNTIHQIGKLQARVSPDVKAFRMNGSVSQRRFKLSMAACHLVKAEGSGIVLPHR